MRIAIVVLGSAFLVTLGCSNLGVQANSTITSTDLKRMVQSRLATEPNLTYVEISADADLNKITLSGWVESQGLRAQAVYMVKTARNNLIVVDKIEVRPQVSMGKRPCVGVSRVNC
jgi:osmotically-inducible protein OsmY